MNFVKKFLSVILTSVLVLSLFSGCQKKEEVSQEMKKVEQNLHQVVHAREKENAGYRYDAKEKGNGHYEKEERKKKDKKQQKADNVYLKGQTSGFDIKV